MLMLTVSSSNLTLPALDLDFPRKALEVFDKLFKVSLNIKKCTNVSGRALHQCKKAHCGKLAYVIRRK